MPPSLTFLSCSCCCLLSALKLAIRDSGLILSSSIVLVCSPLATALRIWFLMVSILPLKFIFLDKSLVTFPFAKGLNSSANPSVSSLIDFSVLAFSISILSCSAISASCFVFSTIRSACFSASFLASSIVLNKPSPPRLRSPDNRLALFSSDST